MQIAENLETVHTAAVELAKEVGLFQLEHFRSMPEGVTDMKAVRETVSFVDIESEKMLKAGLIPMVSGAGFYGEESGKEGSQDLVWIVDPLDGTTNFLGGNDHFCVSIALVLDGETQLGIIHKPFSGEVYSAVRGAGARYNGEIRQAMNPDIGLQDALFVTGFPYRSHDVADAFFSAAPEILKMGRGIRRTGSAALDCAQISMGWMQGFWETDLQPYDIAAAILIMEENGIIYSNHKGASYDMFNDRLMVVGMQHVHEPLRKVVEKHYDI